MDELFREVHPEIAHTVGVVQTGTMFGQTIEPIQHTRSFHDVEITSTEASLAVPGKSLVQSFTVEEVINYIAFCSSMRENKVIVALSSIRWSLASGLYYPFGDYAAAPSQGTVIYRIPAARNYHIEACIFPTTYAQGYVDNVRIVYGYLPDELEQVLR